MMSAASLMKNLPSPPTTRVLPSTEGPKIKNQVWLRNLLISAGLEPVLRQTEKSPISTPPTTRVLPSTEGPVIIETD